MIPYVEVTPFYIQAKFSLCPLILIFIVLETCNLCWGCCLSE